VNPSELLIVLVEMAARIDVQWGLFITVHLALFGAIIYIDRPLKLPEKIGAFILYAVFAYVNYKMMANQIGMLTAVYSELAKFAQDPCCLGNAVIARIENELAGGRAEKSHTMLLAIHISMAILVAIAIVFDRAVNLKIPKKRTK